MPTYFRDAGQITITGTVTSDGYVIGSASCACGWQVGPGAFIGSVDSADHINGHRDCPLTVTTRRPARGYHK